MKYQTCEELCLMAEVEASEATTPKSTAKLLKAMVHEIRQLLKDKRAALDAVSRLRYPDNTGQ